MTAYAHRAVVRRSERAARARQWRRRNDWWEQMTARFAEAAANPRTIVLPGDPMEVRGASLTGVWVDEAQAMPEAPFVPCGRGPCAGPDGHDGTCPEVSGWDEEPLLDRIRHARRVQAAFGLDGSHPDGMEVPLDALMGSGTHANAATEREEARGAIANVLDRLRRAPRRIHGEDVHHDYDRAAP